MPTFKISKCKNDCLQECLNKALSDVTEHQISLWKSSKDNNIDHLTSIDQKKKEIRSWFCEKSFDGYVDTCVDKHKKIFVDIRHPFSKLYEAS